MDKQRITHKEFKSALKIIKLYKNQVREEWLQLKNKSSELDLMDVDSNDVLWYSNLTIKTKNLIQRNESYLGIDIEGNVNQFKNFSISKLQSVKGIGNNTINEIVTFCKYAGIELKP